MRNLVREWRRRNPESVKKHLATRKQRLAFQRWHKEKRLKDIRFRIDTNMASIISMALKGKKFGRKWQELVGYTIDDLMRNLEIKFDDKMNWDNYGSYWEVDHIKPRSSFHYQTAEDLEFKKCWALENLQPLEKIMNRKKSNCLL